MHPFSVLTLGIFVAGYITARWDLVTRLYELAIFAWDTGVFVRFLLACQLLLQPTLMRLADSIAQGLLHPQRLLCRHRHPNRAHCRQRERHSQCNCALHSNLP